MAPRGYVIVAAQPHGVEALEERVSATREGADTEFDALAQKYPGKRIILGDTSGKVLRQG